MPLGLALPGLCSLFFFVAPSLQYFCSDCSLWDAPLTPKLARVAEHVLMQCQIGVRRRLPQFGLCYLSDSYGGRFKLGLPPAPNATACELALCGFSSRIVRL